jgi:hypothetical protein
MAFSGASAVLLALVGLLSSSFCEAAGTAFLPLPTRVGLTEGRGERAGKRVQTVCPCR